MQEQSLALVTGGNRGIGREIARQLGERGYHVMLAARNAPEGIAAARELGLEFTPLDVTSQTSIDRLADSLGRRKLGLDVLVHNAGVMYRHFDLEVASNTIAVNFFGPERLTQALLP
ncbi:MAG TPA: SDR family NAD(P)-dependent oxidoreductase, partial [Nannocystis sp.]